MIGVASNTNGIIVVQATIQDFNQWLKKAPSCTKGALAIPAAIAHVNPD